MNRQIATPPSVINVFSTPYERWSTREPTQEEQIAHFTQHKFFRGPIKVHLLKTITSPFQAAEHLAEHLADSCLENFIDKALSQNKAMQNLSRLMPEVTPTALRDYKCSYPAYDHESVNLEILAHGVLLAEGQELIHGGCWPDGEVEFTTDRPFSTTFCPQIARRSAEWRGKAYDADRMDFIVLRVASPSTKAYLYGTDVDHSHEKEIVFAKEAKLKLISKTYICETTVYKVDSNCREYKKTVPVYVVEAEIS